MKLRNPNSRNAWKESVKALNNIRKRLELSTFKYKALADLAKRSGVTKGGRIWWVREWMAVYERVEAMTASDDTVTAQEIERTFLKDDDYRSTPADYQKFLDDVEEMEV